MAVEFPMPKLGLTMEEGTIVRWLVDDGTPVERGTPVLTIETDKVESDVEASGSGVLRITGHEGELYACGDRIGWFCEPGEAPPADTPPPAPAARPGQPAPAPAVPGGGRAVARGDGRLLASPNARRVAAELGVGLEAVVGTGPGGRIVSEDVLAHRSAGGPAGPAGTPVTATAAAVQVAARLGVDLHRVRPASGGQVDRADVERHVRDRLAGEVGPAVTIDAPLLQAPSRTIALTGMRGTIAQRMHAALRDMAQLTLTMDAVMDAVIEHRSATDPARRAGLTDYVLAAVAAALVEHPVVNSQISHGRLALLPEVNLGLAVALDGGLVVPVVRRADTLSLQELGAQTSRLAAAARNGALSPADLEGGTFSVTALGMYGVDAFTPVVNPPNTAILGVGRLRDAVRWVDDVPTRTTVLTLSLTWDHRAFDGAPAAEFAAAVRDRLEHWGRGS
jgi:pyruvate dehydrogenase E2 component (dihydrolipoamide acetyltransferase)